MGFVKRLGFYLFGLSIGLVFLAMFLRKKSDESGVSFCYLPNCRTLKDIRSKPLHYSDAVSSLLVAQHLDSAAIHKLLFEGEVDFGSSDTKTVPCKTYIIEGTIQKKAAVMTVKNCPEKALVEGVVFW